MKRPEKVILLGALLTLGVSEGFMIGALPRRGLEHAQGRLGAVSRRGNPEGLTRVQADRQQVARGEVVDDDDDDYYYDDPLPEEPDELQQIVKVGRASDGSLRVRKSATLDWLKDLYHKIFWFGLNVDEDEDDEFLDEIDWLEEWSSPHEIRDGWSDEDDGSVYGGSFPFDLQRYPYQKVVETGGASGKKEVVQRRSGVREETPLWRNVKPRSASRGDEEIEDEDDYAAVNRREPRRARKKGILKELSLQAKMAALEEKKAVLVVSKDVWKSRIADMLRSKEADAGKLTRARARLQEINSELAEIDIELKELQIVRGGGRGKGTRRLSVDDDDADEGWARRNL